MARGSLTRRWNEALHPRDHRGRFTSFANASPAWLRGTNAARLGQLHRERRGGTSRFGDLFAVDRNAGKPDVQVKLTKAEIQVVQSLADTNAFYRKPGAFPDRVERTIERIAAKARSSAALTLTADELETLHEIVDVAVTAFKVYFRRKPTAKDRARESLAAKLRALGGFQAGFSS